jgi:adenylate kinase
MNSNRFSPKVDAVETVGKSVRTAWLKGGNHLCLMPPRTPPNKAWRVILLGAPGVGKGTQAELLCERLGCCHLSMGDVCRTVENCPKDDLSPAMQNALDQMKRGELVSDETVLNLVGERLKCLTCSGGFLLDGFPKTVAQAMALEQLLESHQLKLSVVFNFELPIEQIVDRISGRRTCAECKAVYHINTRPPKITDVCEHCGGKLLQREDDQPESVKVRMTTYQKLTQPLIDFYEKRNLLVTIPAIGTPEEIYQRTQLTALTCD